MQANTPTMRRGSALITALFIMTLVAIAATAMSTRLQLDIYRVTLTMTSDKLYLASQEVTYWAMDKLASQTMPVTTANNAGKIADFPSKLRNSYPQVTIHGQLFDLQARFNINNVQDRAFQPIFSRLLKKTIPALTQKERQALVQATAYWVTAYQPGRGQDKYLSFYAKQKPPYLPGYQPMASVSEFRMVRSVNAKTYQALLPFITALPKVTPINLNTASKPLLMALGTGLTEAQVTQLIASRREDGITDINDVYPLLQECQIPIEQITIESSYFLSVATTKASEQILTHYTILKREKDNKKKVVVSIVQDSLQSY